MGIVTVPPAESTLITVARDDRTTKGLYLPHETNNARIDVRRIRAALIILDGLLSGSITESQVQAKIDQAIASLVDTAPGTLDTLNELAAALGDDPNFATTMATQMALLAPKANPVFTDSAKAPTPANTSSDTSIATTAFVRSLLTSLATVSGSRLTAPTRNVGDNGTDAATTAFVVAGFLALTGGLLKGAVLQEPVNLGTLAAAVTVNAASRNVFYANINGSVPITISNLPDNSSQTVELNITYSAGSISFVDSIIWCLGGTQKSNTLADTGLQLTSGQRYTFQFWKNNAAIMGVVA